MDKDELSKEIVRECVKHKKCVGCVFWESDGFIGHCLGIVP